jgi:hypothetical protein
MPIAMQAGPGRSLMRERFIYHSSGDAQATGLAQSLSGANPTCKYDV